MRLLPTALVLLFAGGLTAAGFAQTPEPAASASPAAAASPQPSATRQPGPVQIDRCRLEYTTGGGGFGMFGLIGALAKSTGQLKIKFTNESERELTIVRFAVDLDGNAASIRDVGKFSPGITVDHGFKDFAGSTQWVFSRQAQPKCRVTFVKYADGNSWGVSDDTPDVVASPAPSASP